MSSRMVRTRMGGAVAAVARAAGEGEPSPSECEGSEQVWECADFPHGVMLYAFDSMRKVEEVTMLAEVEEFPHWVSHPEGGTEWGDSLSWLDFPARSCHHPGECPANPV